MGIGSPFVSGRRGPATLLPLCHASSRDSTGAAQTPADQTLQGAGPQDPGHGWGLGSLFPITEVA